jgi:hypothetical protein
MSPAGGEDIMRRTLFAVCAIAFLSAACADPITIPRLPEDDGDEEPDTGEHDMVASATMPEGLILA